MKAFKKNRETLSVKVTIAKRQKLTQYIENNMKHASLSQINLRSRLKLLAANNQCFS
jgi:hypothetical protein